MQYLGDRWCAQRGIARGGILSLEQTWTLAREFYATKREPEWRRKTVDEIEAVFSRLGLAGDFWRLR